MKDTPNWLVIYVASRQEKKVAAELTKRSIHHYLPLAKQLRQWSDRKKWVELPMFNGYLFVQPLPTDIDVILQIPGVVSYLSFERKHAVVRESEIEIIKKIEDSGYFAETLLSPKDFTEGEKVMVIDGPLKGQTVDLVRKNNEKIFMVAFDTLGQSIRVNIPFELLQKADDQQAM